MKAKYLWSILLLLVILLSACMPGQASPTSLPTQGVPTIAPSQTPVPNLTMTAAVPTLAPTLGPTQGSVVVVTATGMSDLGALLGNQPFTPIPGDLLDWDHLEKMEEWDELPGVAEGINVLYIQSGVPNKVDMPIMPGVSDSRVPAGTTLIIGGYTVSLKVGEKSYSITGGFLGAFTEGTEITDVVINDGFAALALRDDAKMEYCARVAQAMNEKWAPFDGKQEVKDHLYRPAAWTDPVCTGVITTPIDSDR